jgi:predicted RNA binding protein YcfA (HicA-like mRNA interferase family)
MSAVNELGTLQVELPQLFNNKNIPEGWDEDYVIMPAPNPERIPGNPDFNDRIDNAHSQNDKGPIYTNVYDDPNPIQVYENENEPFYDKETLQRIIKDNPIYDVFGNQTHAGGLTRPNPKYPVTPPDALAFYLPFHYYLPDWWGIYILAEGVELFALHLMFYCKAYLKFNEAKAIARFYLYHHEAFHHKTECFATRLESSHRIPLYKTGFEKLYQKTVMTNHCLEESLAEATALDKVRAKLKNNNDVRLPQIMDALTTMCRMSPPGYKQGPDMIGANFTPNRHKFSEKNMQECFPKIPSANASVWEVSNHMYHGISNVKSRVNYIIPKSSPICKRIPGIRTRMSPREIRKKLQKLVGIKKMQERTGRHPMYQTNQGKRVPIPEHPGDIHTGTIKSIIKLTGLNLSVREFQTS